MHSIEWKTAFEAKYILGTKIIWKAFDMKGPCLRWVYLACCSTVLHAHDCKRVWLYVYKNTHFRKELLYQTTTN